jgi:Helix-turn-helix domain
VQTGIGSTLRQARKRRKVELSEVEAATKIRVRYLRAMENEEWRPSRRRPRLPPRVLAAIVSIGLVAALVAVGLSSGGEESATPANPGGRADRRHRQEGKTAPAEPKSPGVSVQLAANAEVWVCLLDAGGRHLVDGQILEAGAEEGPFRSGSFTVSFGNGEVSMRIDGREESIPPSASPVGYSIDSGGGLRKLSESERPTCT